MSSFFAMFIVASMFDAMSSDKLHVAAVPSPKLVNQIWRDSTASKEALDEFAKSLEAVEYSAFTIDEETLEILLSSAPAEGVENQSPVYFSLPLPDGSRPMFAVFESPVMAPDLAMLYPEIKTYSGYKLDEPNVTTRFSWTPLGFNAIILTPKGTAFVLPQSDRKSKQYLSCFFLFSPVNCQFQDDSIHTNEGATPRKERGPTPVAKRTFRLAMSATGEFTVSAGGTTEAGLAAVVSIVNQINAVFQVEIAVRLELVANNYLLIFTNSATDPFSRDCPSAIVENQDTCDLYIGTENYDIGHVVGVNQSGRGVCCPCNFSKAKGCSGHNFPSSLGGTLHELGHQLGASHTFNSSSGGACASQRNAGAAYEPGSGSTIMSYAGSCLSNNIATARDLYYHSHSLGAIQSFLDTHPDCGDTEKTTNIFPTVEAGQNYVIPRETPFTLTVADSGDENDDTLTYCWEQRNLGVPQNLPLTDNGSSPIIRSRPATINPSRTIPPIENVLNNTFPPGEILPSTNRELNFRVTVRDNHTGTGGTAWDDMILDVEPNAGPFLVTLPNTSVIWSGIQTVTWDVANTDQSPISTSNVRISLSLDGGQTFPLVLATATPNDGSENVTLPNVSSDAARVRIEAVGNVYFDVSDSNFTVCYLCDMNCDSFVDSFDLDPFILALLDPQAYQQQYPTCNPLNGDANNDDVLDYFDLDSFVECVTNCG